MQSWYFNEKIKNGFFIDFDAPPSLYVYYLVLKYDHKLSIYIPSNIKVKSKYLVNAKFHFWKKMFYTILISCNSFDETNVK